MSDYSYRRSGTNGCEIIDPNGLVIAWTVDRRSKPATVTMCDYRAEADDVSVMRTPATSRQISAASAGELE